MVFLTDGGAGGQRKLTTGPTLSDQAYYALRDDITSGQYHAAAYRIPGQRLPGRRGTRPRRHPPGLSRSRLCPVGLTVEVLAWRDVDGWACLRRREAGQRESITRQCRLDDETVSRAVDGKGPVVVCIDVLAVPRVAWRNRARQRGE